MPFSIFPRTYKEVEAVTTTKTHEELEIKLPAKPEKAGREGQHSSFSATAQLPPRREQRYTEEEVRIEERYHRPGVKHEHREHYEEYRLVAFFINSATLINNFNGNEQQPRKNWSRADKTVG